MGIVGYSDSEGSDAEAESKVAVNKPSKPSATSNKPAFHKVVDRSNPRKIQVTLPGVGLSKDESGSNNEDGKGLSEGNERPAKKAKTGGAFSDFNSFLPAPKNTAKPVSANSSATDGGNGRISRLRGAGLGTGVNLKTGAAPAFSRSQDFEDTYSKAVENDGPADYAQPAIESVAAPPPEVKLVGKPNMFKPLSVARKPAKKKVPSEGTGVTEGTKPSTRSLTQGNAVKQEISSVPKAKRSLFSTEEVAPSSDRSASSTGEYVPLDAPIPVPTPSNTEDYEEIIPSQYTSQQQQPATLGALADSLSLTPAQRRQLFGRKGGEAAAAQIANFNLSAEYRHNTELRESGETAPLHNPIRSIAPGKHSLQQLVNMATNQRDALEESFAAGKTTKKEAGSKYGW